MACLKCGAETQNSFCEKCLADMVQYPQQSGVAILYSRERSAYFSRKESSRENAVTIEEDQMISERRIRFWRRTALFFLVTTLLLAGLTAGILLTHPETLPKGRNYHVVGSTTETAQP